jgi:hypothetical protein
MPQPREQKSSICDMVFRIQYVGLALHLLCVCFFGYLHQQDVTGIALDMGLARAPMVIRSGHVGLDFSKNRWIIWNMCHDSPPASTCLSLILVVELVLVLYLYL